MKATKMRRVLAENIRIAKHDIADEGEEGRLHHEAIHGVRVSARRLREYCRIAKRTDLVRDLSWLIRRLGALRDLDVARSTRHSKSNANWLKGEALEQARHALATLRSRRARQLVAALRHLPSLKTKRAKKRIRRLERKARSGIPKLHKTEEVHAFRRTLRHLRYCHEWLGDDVGSLATLQTRLGAVIDLAMRVTLAKGFLASKPRDRAAATRSVKLREVELARTLAQLSLGGVQI